MEPIKLLELQALLQTDPDKILPLLEQDNCTGQLATVTGDSRELVCWLLENLLHGRFDEIFSRKEILQFLKVDPSTVKWEDGVLESIDSFLGQPNVSDIKCRQLIVLFTGIAALQFFVQLNFVGPVKDLNNALLLPISLLNVSTNEDLQSTILQSLTLCNEEVYPLIKCADLLLLSRIILHETENKLLTSFWWKLRYLSVHQAVLLERNSAVYSLIINAINDSISNPVVNSTMILNQLYVEAALLSLCFHDVSKGKEYLKVVQENSGLSIKLLGALGKRTQFQQIPYSQLFLNVGKEKIYNQSLYAQESIEIPKDLKLDDDTLLNQIKFMESENENRIILKAEEQAIILALSTLHQKQNAHDDLLIEEMMAYVDSILSVSTNFCVTFCALLLRCKLEKQRSRKVERAMMQLQSLSDHTKASADNASNRLQLFYSTPMSPTWVVEKELANVLLSLGSVKSALDIFLKLQMWEECVFCYQQLQRNDKALEIIESEIVKHETPLLLCLKGDVTNEPSWYEKAWVEHRSGRAKRSLGYFHFKKKEFKECIPHLLQSVEINSMEQRAWYFLGHAATQIQDYELAAKSYRTLVNLDPDSFEAWNNLSNAYIKLNDKIRAWRTLQEAIKCNFEEWRVWENYLLVCVDVGAFEEAINAFHRLIDIKGKHADDEVLNILVKAVVENLKDIHDNPASNLMEKTLKLLGHLTSTETSSYRTWNCYATLLEHKAVTTKNLELLDRVIQYQQKSFSIMKMEMQNNTKEKSVQHHKDLLVQASRLADVYLKRFQESEGDSKDKQQLHPVKLTLNNAIALSKREETHFTEKEVEEIIKPTVEVLETKLNVILNITEE